MMQLRMSTNAQQCVRYTLHLLFSWTSPTQKRLFHSNSLDLSNYDALELCIRGDGRRYIANLQAPGLARKDDLWQCLVYTRGGPLWECLRVCGCTHTPPQAVWIMLAPSVPIHPAPL